MKDPSGASLPIGSRIFVAAVTLCGPPPSINEVSWYGRTQPATPGTGTQTVATPLRIGIPSAPGKVPK